MNDRALHLGVPGQARSILSRLPQMVACLALILAAVPGFSASRVDCARMESKTLPRPVPYCVMLPPSYDEDKTRRYPVLYYLHGLGDNEQSLVNGGGWNMYEDLLAQKKVGEYIIVTPNGYRGFYVNARDGKFPYGDFFVKEFIPAIERRYRIRAERASRGIMGISMGGYAAFHYGFKYPEKFASVSAHMAALMQNAPRNMGSTREGRLLGDVFGDPVDAAYYRRNSPFTFARSQPAAALNRLAIYFDVGRNDGYGFDTGNIEMDKLLSSRGVKHEFHVFPGGHDWSYAMQHFGASLEWHSRALGAK